MKRLGQFFLGVIVAAALGVALFGPRASHAVSLRMPGGTNDVGGAPAVLFQITNCSGIPFACTYQAQVLTNAFWTTPDCVPGKHVRSAFGTRALPGKSAFECAFSAPVQGMNWRVLVFYNQGPGTIRAKTDELFRKLRLPLRINKRRFIVGPELKP